MVNRKLKLNVIDFITHYDAVVFLFGLGLYSLLRGLVFGTYVENYPLWNRSLELKFAVFFIMLGLWGFYKQVKRLKFESIPLETLSKDEAFTIAKQILIDFGWLIVKEKENSLEAEGKGFRSDSFDIRTYRNKITIILEEGELRMNCIVQPPRNGQFVTFGKIKQLYEDFYNLFLDQVYHWETEKRKSSCL